jgi:hypothetical protein
MLTAIETTAAVACVMVAAALIVRYDDKVIIGIEWFIRFCKKGRA